MGSLDGILVVANLLLVHMRHKVDIIACRSTLSHRVIIVIIIIHYPS